MANGSLTFSPNFRGDCLIVNQRLSRQINAGVEAAIAQAIERHRKLEEAIAVWQDGEVVVLTADQIPQMRDGLERQQSREKERQKLRGLEMGE
jgi:hypothetical protein